MGLDAVLADGTVIRTGGAPRAAAGPDLTQVFVGSEGTLGMITGRAAAPPSRRPRSRATRPTASPRSPRGSRRADASLHRGATPAVLRLYDAIESDRHFDTGETCTCCSCSTKASRDRRRRDGGGARRVRGADAARPRARRPLARPSQRRAACSSRSSPRARWSTRSRSRRGWRDLAACHRRGARRGARGRRHASCARSTSRTRTATVRAATSPSAASHRPIGARALLRRGVRRRHARGRRARRGAQPPPRRRSEPRPLHGRRARQRIRRARPPSSTRSTPTGFSTPGSSDSPTRSPRNAGAAPGVRAGMTNWTRVRSAVVIAAALAIVVAGACGAGRCATRCGRCARDDAACRTGDPAHDPAAHGRRRRPPMQPYQLFCGGRYVATVWLSPFVNACGRRRG